MRAWLTDRPLTPAELLAQVGSAADGAVVLFLGTVRSENDGRAVQGLRYDAYVEMAERVLADIAEEAARRAGIRRIAVAHRIGELTVGEISVGIAISAPHRAEAYDGSRYIIEEIKKRLPVWKQEHYAGGERVWLDGETPRPAEAAEAEATHD